MVPQTDFNPGFQEMMQRQTYILPSESAEADERTWQEKKVFLTLVGTAFTLLPFVADNFVWLPMIGAFLILIGAFKLSLVNGFFRVALIFASCLLLELTTRAVSSLFEEIPPVGLEDILAGKHEIMPSFAEQNFLASILGLGTVLCLPLGVCKMTGQLNAWAVISPVAYGILLVLSFAGSADWVILVKAVMAFLSGFAYYKVYDLIKH